MEEQWVIRLDDNCPEKDEKQSREMDKQWAMRMDEELRRMCCSPAEYPWAKLSIYRVPKSLAAIHREAYMPRLVSLGPYHHGEEELEPMEQHKCRALRQFLKRALDNRNSPLDIIGRMRHVMQQLRDSYEGLEERWNEGNTFLELMIRDGCFILEVLRVGAMKDPNPTDTGYHSKDPVFSAHGKLYVMPLLRRDMLMLENQLPMLALTTLTEAAGGQMDDLTKLVDNFWGLTSVVARESLHILDAYRRAKTSKGDFKYTQEENIWSATELREGGIRFYKSDYDSFKDVSFSGRTLKLPRIDVDDNTETILLNLMAFERLHVGAGNAVTSYVCLMDTLIDTAKDVELLRRKKIVQGWVGSDDNVASLFNKISKEASVDINGTNTIVLRQVNEYRKNTLNRWRASFKHTYLANPWVFLSLVGAIFLLGLTVLQSVYTVLQYH